MRAPDPAAKLARAAVAPAREGLWPDARGGRRGGCRSGRRHGSASCSSPRARARRPAVLRRSGRDARRSPCGSGSRARPAPTSTRCTRSKRARCAAARRSLLRGAEQVARVLDLPWEGTDPDHWAERGRGRGTRRARGQARPRERRRRRSRRCDRGPWTRPRRSSPSPGSRITTRCGDTWRQPER